jgi:hypothetical protein
METYSELSNGELLLFFPPLISFSFLLPLLFFVQSAFSVPDYGILRSSSGAAWSRSAPHFITDGQ